MESEHNMMEIDVAFYFSNKKSVICCNRPKILYFLYKKIEDSADNVKGNELSNSNQLSANSAAEGIAEEISVFHFCKTIYLLIHLS